VDLGDNLEQDSNLYESGATGALSGGQADRVWTWTGLDYRYAWLVDTGGLYPQYDGNWFTGNASTDIELEPGKGYWIQVRDNHSAFIWNYPKHYSEPPNE
jgi:hypothetical protein